MEMDSAISLVGHLRRSERLKRKRVGVEAVTTRSPRDAIPRPAKRNQTGRSKAFVQGNAGRPTRQTRSQVKMVDYSHGYDLSHPQRLKRPADTLRGDHRYNLVEDVEERPAKQARITTHTGTKGAKSDVRGDRKVLPSRRSRVKGRIATTNVPKEVITVHSLPPELLGLIMEELWNRTTDEGSWNSTLCTCTLVCSRWWDAARPFIFRHVIIRNPEHIHQLAKQIHYEPKIALWIRKLRFEGKSVPKSEILFPTPSSRVEEDLDTWIYSFFTIIGTYFPNVKSLDIFGFQHLSQRREDLEVFSRWIPHLASLNSVESLHLARIEMPPNALTAIVRAFPNLHHVTLTCVNLAVPNVAELAEISLMSDLEHIGDTLEVPDSGGLNQGGAVKYPVLHDVPWLYSFSVDNDLSDYNQFKFSLVRDWLVPSHLGTSLQNLHIGGAMNWRLVSRFIADLGASQVLRSLRVFIEITEDVRSSIGLDISKLTNLRSITLDFPQVYLDAGMTDYVCQLFAQLNVARLEHATLRLVWTRGLEYISHFDTFLCGERFRELKQLDVSIADYSDEEKVEDPAGEAKALFPNMHTRGILRVVEATTTQMP